MNWDDPTERFHLIEMVGHSEYNRRLQQHLEGSIIELCNGYALRTVNSNRYGRLVCIDGTKIAYSTVEQARKYATELPPGPRA